MDSDLHHRRARVLDLAISMYSKRGFHATGIDTLTARAKVSKRTLYQMFGSKENLIVAALTRDCDATLARFTTGVEQTPGTAENRLLAVFDIAGKWFREATFFGCLFINAVGEHSDQRSPVHKAARKHKQRMVAFVEGLCRATDVVEPVALARKMTLLLEGATVTAQVSGRAGSALIAKEMARALLACADRNP